MSDWEYCGKFFHGGIAEFINEVMILNDYIDKEEWNNLPPSVREEMMNNQCNILITEEQTRTNNPDFNLVNDLGNIVINGIDYEHSFKLCARGGAPRGSLNGYADHACVNYMIYNISNIFIIACGSMNATRGDAGDNHKGSVTIYGGRNSTYPVLGSLNTYLKRDGTSNLPQVFNNEYVGIKVEGWCTSGLSMLVGINIPKDLPNGNGDIPIKEKITIGGILFIGVILAYLFGHKKEE